MTDPLLSLRDSVAALLAAWPARTEAREAAALSPTELIGVNDAVGALKRQLDGVRSSVAAEISRRSRPELGSDSLAKQQGFRNSTVLIATATGASLSDAARLVKVGEATAPRVALTGEALPAKRPHLAAAITAGTIGVPAASAIIGMLDRLALRVDGETLERAERALAEQAPGLSLDQLTKVVARTEALLDADGLEPREQELRAARSLRMFERDGMLHLTAVLDPESAAPVKAAIEALVTAEFRAGTDAAASAFGFTTGDSSGLPAGDGTDPDAPRRTVAQRQADALVRIAQHVLGCDHEDLPLAGATVIVRVTLDDLESGRGAGLIDGIIQPVSIGTVRRMAANGGVIPWVMGTDSEILDWGRERRLFSPSQRLALAERDGGCTMCGLPPGMTKAHHLKWWAKDAGPTDLDNGVLLCESCHHRIHDNGWEILIDGTGTRAQVWFVPPSHVDPARTPRLGGRARFDSLAA